MAIAEANVTINGRTLTDAQSMTVRCAVETFASSLSEGLGDDEHGRFMTKAYRDRINEIRALMARMT
jgi:hypothetical protein